MSTRACIHFCDSDTGRTEAIVYRHCDGYPAGLGKDLKTFFKEVRDNVEDNRLDDPKYLAAKFIVWQAKQYTTKSEFQEEKHYLDFLGLGVTMEDHGDIAYRYDVMCGGTHGGKKLPKVVVAQM